MDPIWYAGGAALILAGLIDIFFGVLHYDGFGPFSGRIYPLVWRLTRGLARAFPRGRRSFVMSLGAPLMVPATISLWLLLELLGFALLYTPGLRNGHFRLEGLEPSFWEALYVSGVTLSTLGYGDITPTARPFEVLAFMEALTGFIILTLSISYVLNIYQALQRLSSLGVALHHQTSQGEDRRSLLGLYLEERTIHHLSQYLMNLHQELVAHYEDVRRYPIVYYFHSRRPYRSMPYAFWIIGELAGAIRWGLPSDHQAARDPWLPTLITSWLSVTERLEERFANVDYGEEPEPVPFEHFSRAIRGRAEPDDRWLRAFVELEEVMRDLASIEKPTRPREAYERYVDWLPFAFRASRFLEDTARFLGYDPERLTGQPAERLF